MGCISVTVAPDKATISSFYYVGPQGTNHLFKLVLGGGSAGSIKTSVDGVQIGNLITPIVKNEYDMLFTLTPGVHNVCVDIV